MSFELQVKFTNRQYESFLNRLRKFILLVSTVGIHDKDGRKSMSRKYTKMLKSGKTTNKIAGRSHRMSLIKVAYQNEFGAEIKIRPRYRTTTRTRKIKTYNTFTQRISRYSSVKQSTLRSANEQGYLLLDKSGKFVKYYPPNSIITVPERSFLRKTAKNIDSATSATVCNIILQSLVTKNMSPRTAFEKISKLIKLKVQANMRNSESNNPITVKAKGRNSPLQDEQNRLIKAIKYKIYNNPAPICTKAHVAFMKNFETRIDKLLASAKQYDKIPTQITQTTRIYTYSKGNFNFLK